MDIYQDICQILPSEFCELSSSVITVTMGCTFIVKERHDGYLITIKDDEETTFPCHDRQDLVFFFQLHWGNFKPIHQLSQSLSPWFNLLGISPQNDGMGLSFKFFDSQFSISSTMDGRFSIYRSSPCCLKLSAPEEAVDRIKQMLFDTISKDFDIISSYLSDEFIMVDNKTVDDGLSDLVCRIINQQTELLYLNLAKQGSSKR